MDYEFKSEVLESLGVRSWINARNWVTALGGCWIDDRVLEAMNQVAKTFVDMYDLYEKADAKVAELCKVEEAHITSGTCTSIEFAVAGCMAGDDFGRWSRLPDTEGMKNEVVFPRGHYTDYGPSWRASGAKLVEYGQAGLLKLNKKELESKITEKTCCLSYTVSYNVSAKGEIPLEEVVKIGRKYDLPVLVDAASMLPPVSNLHKFTDIGADIVFFSGGKAIRAPNNTGIMLGKGRGAEIIRSVRDNTFPHSGWGRGRKVSKEQVVGLVKALQIFVEEGDAQYGRQMETAKWLMRQLKGIPHVETKIIPNDETLHEHPVMPLVPRLLVEWDGTKIGLTAEDVDEAMTREDPPIWLKERHYFNYFTDKEWRIIDTYFLRPGEDEIVADRLKRILTKKKK